MMFYMQKRPERHYMADNGAIQIAIIIIVLLVLSSVTTSGYPSLRYVMYGLIT